MEIKFQRELSSSDLHEELLPLLKTNHGETSAFKDLELSPSFEKYNALEKAGILRVFTARDMDGLLVGYAIFIVGESLHYRGSVQALQDVIYIKPGARAGAIGLRFLKWCDVQFNREGISIVLHQTSIHRDIGPLLRRAGYELICNMYARRIDHGC